MGIKQMHSPVLYDTILYTHHTRPVFAINLITDTRCAFSIFILVKKPKKTYGSPNAMAASKRQEMEDYKMRRLSTK